MKRTLLFAALVLTLSLPATAQRVESDAFTIRLRGIDGPVWWEAVYDRSLPSGAGWTDGDRQQYRCAYMFLEYRGRIVGRVTFTRVTGANYAVVQDDGMADYAVRFFDGTVVPPDAPREVRDCPEPTQTYEPYSGPDQRPTIQFVNRRGALETRDYKTTVADSSVTFRQVESSPSRVTVVAYVDGLPAIVVYYDSLVSGVRVVSDVA